MESITSLPKCTCSKLLTKLKMVPHPSLPHAAVPTYQKMKEVRIIMPYVKNKLATERVYVHWEEDWKIEADEGYVTVATKRRRRQ